MFLFRVPIKFFSQKTKPILWLNKFPKAIYLGLHAV